MLTFKGFERIQRVSRLADECGLVLTLEEEALIVTLEKSSKYPIDMPRKFKNYEDLEDFLSAFKSGKQYAESNIYSRDAG